MNRLLDRLWRWVDSLVRPAALLADHIHQRITDQLQAAMRTGLDENLDDAAYSRRLSGAVTQYQNWLGTFLRDTNTIRVRNTRRAFATLRADLHVSFPRSYERELLKLQTQAHGRYRQTDATLQQMVRQLLNQHAQTQMDRKTLVNTILQQAERDGYDLWVNDSRGRRIRIDHYVKRAVDGYTSNLALAAYQQQMQTAGLDLVMVSINETTCPKCAPWQGRTLSLNGTTTGYPTLAEARAGGLFHISCRHGLRPTTP